LVNINENISKGWRLVSIKAMQKDCRLAQKREIRGKLKGAQAFIFNFKTVLFKWTKIKQFA